MLDYPVCVCVPLYMCVSVCVFTSDDYEARPLDSTAELKVGLYRPGVWLSDRLYVYRETYK